MKEPNVDFYFDVPVRHCLLWTPVSKSNSTLGVHLHAMLRTHHFDFDFKFWPISALMAKTLHWIRIWRSVLSVICFHQEKDHHVAKQTFAQLATDTKMWRLASFLSFLVFLLFLRSSRIVNWILSSPSMPRLILFSRLKANKPEVSCFGFIEKKKKNEPLISRLQFLPKKWQPRLKGGNLTASFLFFFQMLPRYQW